MTEIIQLNNINFCYKKSSRPILTNISFTIEKGSIFGFLGPNGAGKTTTIKILLGLIKPNIGKVKILAKKDIGYMPEIAHYYWYLTPIELLNMYGSLFGIGKNILNERIDSLLKLVGLYKERKVLMKNFSKGMMQKVSFVQALINDPELLILDEPTSGLDPLSRLDLRDTLINIKQRGKTIFFSSHELSEVETISDSIAIIDKGNILCKGNLNTLLQEKREKISLEKYFLHIIQSNA